MKPQFFSLLLLLAALAGCTSAPAEHEKIDAVAAFFGENVRYTKGSHLSTNPTEPQGKYLEITVRDDKLARQYGDLGLPASNCAYLTYSNLPAAERQQYDFLKVTLQDSLAAHSYAFPKAELALATQAAIDLDTLMTYFKDRKYQSVVNKFNPGAITPDMQTKLPASLLEIEHKTGPVQQYYLEGYAPTQVPLAGKPQQLVRLFVTLSRPQKSGRMLVVINPQLRPNEKFLYGLNILN